MAIEFIIFLRTRDVLVPIL